MKQYICDGSRDSKWYFDTEKQVFVRDMVRRKGTVTITYAIASIANKPDEDDVAIQILKKYLTDNNISSDNLT